MAKATKLPAPFKLNSEGRKALALDNAAKEACRVFWIAAEAEEAAFQPKRKGQKFDHDYSPATQVLRDKWHASMRETGEQFRLLVERIEGRKRLTPADAVTLLIAVHHTTEARHLLVAAFDTAFGLGLMRKRP